MTARERVARRPPGLQLRDAANDGDALGLTAVPEVHALRTALVARVAHDGPRVAERLAVGADGALDVRQVGAEDGHFVARVLELLNDVFVPSNCVGDVRVGLCCVVLAAVETVTNVPGVHGANGEFGGHFVNVHLRGVFAESLIGLFRAGFNGGVANGVFAIDNLIDDTDADAFGVFGAIENGFDCGATFKVAVTGNGNVNGALIEGAVVASVVTARCSIRNGAASNFHGSFARHEFVLVHRRTPKFGHFHDGFAISGMHQAVVGGLVFIANGNGPLSGRNFNRW